MLSLLITLSSPAAAEEAPPIVNGWETSDYEAVGVLYAANNQGYGSPFCSATLIHERWAVTAAHCVDAFRDMAQYGYPNIFILFGESVYTQTGIFDYVQVAEGYIPDNYNANTTDHDIALCEMVADVTSVEPMPIREDPVLSLNGDTVSLVGWGIIAGNNQSQNTAGVKRTVDVPVNQVDSDKIYTYDDSPNGGNACSGDSGGALFIWEDDGPVLAGAMSYVYYGTNQDYCSGGTASTRVDKHIDWFSEYFDVSEAGGGSPEPEEEPEDVIDDTGLDTADTGLDTADAGQDTADVGESTLSAGCGCSGVGGTAGGLWVSLLGLAAARRRRAQR